MGHCIARTFRCQCIALWVHVHCTDNPDHSPLQFDGVGDGRSRPADVLSWQTGVHIKAEGNRTFNIDITRDRISAASGDTRMEQNRLYCPATRVVSYVLPMLYFVCAPGARIGPRTLRRRASVVSVLRARRAWRGRVWGEPPN